MLLSDSERVFTNIRAGTFETFDAKAFSKLLGLSPDVIREQVASSGLSGRGGGAFPVGRKWSLLKEKKKNEKRYLVINGDEGEIGTFKDKALLSHEPFKVLTGAFLAARAVFADHVFVYVNGKYLKEIDILKEALQRMGASVPVPLSVYAGGGGYVCGEESAMLNSLEGRRGSPRLRPPYPSESGLYGASTVVHNVETVAYIPAILERGADWFKGTGNGGLKLFSLSGDIKNTGLVVEERLGVPLRVLLTEYGGGVSRGLDNLLCVFPGGGGSLPLPSSLCHTLLMDDASVREAGSLLGTGGVIVIGRHRHFPRLFSRLMRFYRDESCGFCSPCREGTVFAANAFERFGRGLGYGRASDLETLEELLDTMENMSFCAFTKAAAAPVRGVFKHFRSLFS